MQRSNKKIFSAFLAATMLLICLMPSVGFAADMDTVGVNAKRITAAVRAGKKSGTYYKPIEVKLTCATKNAVIRYTTDGSTPKSSSKRYTGKLAVKKDTVIKARAYAKNRIKSKVSTFSYTIKLLSPEAISLNKTKLTLDCEETFQIKTTFSPAKTYYKSLKYSSSDKAVAKVSSAGKITALKTGDAVITVKTANGIKEKISVTVQKVDVSKFTTYYQGDKKWKFRRAVRKKACYITAYAMLVSNLGIKKTPRDVYKACGNRTTICVERANKKLGVVEECALAKDSKYLSSYSNGKTYIKNPKKNGQKALKEALKRNPEGVLVYHKRGGRAHAVVAIRCSNNKIYYCDPGRDPSKAHNITFANTWNYYRHKMTDKNIAWIVALNPAA